MTRWQPLPVITANTVWKEFKTTLKARLKHVTAKDKWWVDKVRTGDTSQTHADQAIINININIDLLILYKVH